MLLEGKWHASLHVFMACSLEVVIKLASTARVKLFDGEYA